VGIKDSWLRALAGVKPVIDVHQHNLLFSSAMKTKLKSMEAFREKAYQLKGIWHVGWGFRDGFKGLKVDAATTMTLEAANKLFEQSTDEMADTIQMVVGVPLKQFQLDGLGLFCWNLGTGVLQPLDKVTNTRHDSTLVSLMKAGDFAGAAAEFEKFNKWRPTPDAPLEVSEQLSVRRKYERSIFEGKVDLNPKPVFVPAAPQTAPKPLPTVVVAKPGPSPQALPAPKPVAVPKPIQPPAPWWVRLLEWLLIQATKP
jgi:lysozyme